ncbi:MAG: hypothetical protein QNL05_10975 [Gammaproteobacteria bacterium]|nr:hypothetical protein [Gammaproteobacteria bacterium]MDX2488080.1 hypothetical protein [Gammaproteobacteria bacterium]
MPVLTNPASRILSLALLTILVNTQGWAGLLIFVLPLIYLFYRHPEPGRQAILLAKRLRWFFLSILILYLWFYPGSELIPMMGRFSPSVEGINEAVLRITSLLLVISYSVFLVQLTPRDDIICGIQFILSPLSYLRIDTSRFALRLGLVLSIVPKMMEGEAFSKDGKGIKSISTVIDQAALMVKQADEKTNDFDLTEVAACELGRPGVMDVFVPLSLLIWLVAA